MTFLRLRDAPTARGRDALVHVRDEGEGDAVLLLHGGWGYGYYPFDDATKALVGDGFRVVAPDRLGFGRSDAVEGVAPDFHERAAHEMLALLDALDIEEARLWGHSDGAVVALHLARLAPARFPRLVVEATHLWRRKPTSRQFFQAMAEAPESLGERVAARLEAEHGARWRTILAMHGRAWLRLADEAAREDEDLYGGRLRDVRAPVLVLHGGRDPRTEPGEVEALLRALPDATPCHLPDASHAPHAERASASEATERAVAFLRGRQ